MSVRNLPEIRKWNLEGITAFGARLHETLTDMVRQISTISQQVNGNVSANPSAPPPLQSFTVQPHENGFDMSIEHNGDLYRGVHYYVDYADNPNFQGVRTVHVGETRNAVLPLGSRTLYFRAWAKYPFSASTSPVVHGASTPQAVTGGVKTPFLGTQGCGTSLANEQPFQQPAFRSVSGAPPVRNP
jgi:hypothetical protein